MENNIQRYKGNDNSSNYMNPTASNPYQNISNVSSINEYPNQDTAYNYNSTGGPTFPNYQMNYRPTLENYEHNSFYTNFSYDASANNNYMYHMPQNVQSFPEGHHISNDQNNPATNLSDPNYQFSNAYEQRPNAPMFHANMNNSIRNFPSAPYRYSEPPANNGYYQDLMYSGNYGDNMYNGYPPNMPMNVNMSGHIKQRLGPINSQHPRNSNFQQRPQNVTKVDTVPTISPAADVLKSTLLSTTKNTPKPSLPLPVVNNTPKGSNEVKNINFGNIPVTGENSNSSKSNLSSFNSQLNKSSSHLVDYQMNIKEFPTLCETFKNSTSPSIPRIVPSLLNMKPNASSDDSLGNKRGPASINTPAPQIPPVAKPPVVLPTLSKFITQFENISIKLDVSNNYEFAEILKHPNKSLLNGKEITDYGLNITTSENFMLYKSLVTPFETNAQRSTNLDYPVPHEYLIYQSIKEHISKFNCHNFTEDILFHLYYMEEDDAIKLSAISNLYSRRWRYHKTNKIWIHLPSNYSPGDSYTFFDPIRWETVTSDVAIDFKHIEDNTYSSYLEYEVPIILAQNSFLNNPPSDDNRFTVTTTGAKQEPIRVSKTVNVTNDTATTA